MIEIGKKLTSAMSKVMSSMQSLKTTLPYLIGWSNSHKPITEQYPDRVSSRMPEDLPVRSRGLLTNDIERCSGCLFCAEVCPVDCIEIKTEVGAEANQSWVATFKIDHGKCMFCGLCVEMCPTKSLVHTREYRAASFSKAQIVQDFGKGHTTDEMRKRWEVDQKTRAARAEELAMYEENPVGAELQRLGRANKPQGEEPK